ncbi:MAG: hypothetical protein EGS53_05960 [Prevotella sp.]|nr:hypothetical protein [Prevotella sp.]
MKNIFFILKLLLIKNNLEIVMLFQKEEQIILNNQFFFSFLMNNPKELDSETGHLHGIGERVDLSRFMNGTTIKDLML